MRKQPVRKLVYRSLVSHFSVNAVTFPAAVKVGVCLNRLQKVTLLPLYKTRMGNSF